MDTQRPGTSAADAGRSGRFAELSPAELDGFVSDQQNKETTRKTRYHISLFKQFLIENNDDREIKDNHPAELDPLVGRFLCVVRKEDGSEYEPSYLRGMLNSLERHLRWEKYESSLTLGAEFFMAREKLKAKQKELRKQGKGNLPNKADALTDDDINHLYEAQQLGPCTPQSVINTLWLNNMLHFGMRAVKEHRSLCWGDVQLKRDREGREFLEMTTEHQTKTRTGENVNDVRPVRPQMYAYPTDIGRCPVALYKHYRALRPGDFNSPETPFYLAIKDNNPKSPTEKTWFKRQAMGPNTIGNIMKNMSTESGLSDLGKKLTNTSARKYMLQKLNDEMVPPTHTMQKSAHKNVQSVNNYCKLSDKQQFAMSHILCDTKGNRNEGNVVQTSFPSSSNAVATSSNYMKLQMKEHKHTEKIEKSRILGSTAIFSDCNITGGTFRVTLNVQSEGSRVRKRPRVLYSDSDSQSSQEN
ncbi:uncharacterized protein KIAA1958 homolog [Ptychodera flava]|uniref:uncharacterized protein KIAA1958 homolog n=1 Tax=Ptychodera flava TaxID=63121 RepID=UPI00396AACCE